MTIGYVQETLSADDTYTDALEIHDNFNVSVVLSDLKIATVTLQRTFDNEVTWKDVKAYTTSYEDSLFNETERPVKYRIGIKPQHYSGTGNAIVRIRF